MQYRDEVKICYPAALHVGKETPVPIEEEAGVQGDVAGVEASGATATGSRNGGKFGGEINILSEKIDF